MNQTDRFCTPPRFTLQVDGKARGCVGTAAIRCWQSQEPLPLGVESQAFRSAPRSSWKSFLS
jgi:hypothetical protein